MKMAELLPLKVNHFTLTGTCKNEGKFTQVGLLFLLLSVSKSRLILPMWNDFGYF